jgi:hypothetical protein
MQGDQGIKNLGGREEEVGSWDLRGGAGSGSMGKRFLVRKGDKREPDTIPFASVPVVENDSIVSAASFASDHDTADANAYLLRRVLNGVPEGPNELVPGTSLPLESCMDVMGGSE